MAKINLEEGINQLGSDIKTVYDMALKNTTDIENIKRAMLVLDGKDSSSDVLILNMEVQKQNEMLTRLLDILRRIAIEKKLIEQKTPQQELAEELDSFSKPPQAPPAQGKRTCLHCLSIKDLVNLEPTPKMIAGENYYVGYCADCGKKNLKRAK